MATKRWNSNKVKMNGLGGNAASVDDIKDAGLWGTVQDTPLVKGADGKTYAEMPAGWSNVNGNHGTLDKDYVEANRGSFGNADNAYTSDADWNSIQKHKDDWKKAYEAGDQAGMDAAHNAAQAIRANYGYSGGADGSKYNPLMFKSDSWYGYADGEDESDSGWGYGGKPGYTNRYQQMIDELTGKILGRDPFSYDAEQDPLYGQYKQSYTRNGQRAMQDTLGQVSARTGGLASSYAESAAQQTYNNYMAALADKIPELQQLAYSMYQDELSSQRSDLSMLQALESGDYEKYRDLLAQWNTDRSFDYGTYRDSVADSQWQKNFDYQQNRDQVADSQWQQNFDYNKSQDAFSNDWKEREWAYQLQKANAKSGGSSGKSGSSRGSSTSGGSTGGADWSAVREYVDKYGGDAEDYIGANYKALGYSSKSAAVSAWKVYQQVDSTGGYNKTKFDAAMSSLNSMLGQGKTDTIPGALDNLWPQLSDTQKSTLQKLLRKYGLQYEGD